jgi:hypothetical protein
VTATAADGVLSALQTKLVEVQDRPATAVVEVVGGSKQANVSNNPVEEGTPVVVELSGRESGSDTLTSWTVNWGDGTTQTLPLDRELGLSLQIRGRSVALFADG